MIVIGDSEESLAEILDLKSKLHRNTGRKNDLRKLPVKGFIESEVYCQELRRFIERQKDEVLVFDEALVRKLLEK